MEELKVSQQLGSISTNLDAIESGLKEYVKSYNNYVVTQDSISEDKKTLAELRKLKTSMEDARKSVKKEWEKPYKDFEERYKKVLELVDKPITLIAEQLKSFDEARAAEKKKHVQQLYEETIGEYAEYLPFDSIFDPKWLNATAKDKDIEYDISEKKTRIISDINVIKSLKSEIESELLETYKSKGNVLAAAIERNQQYIQDKSRVESAIKAESIEKRPSAEAMGPLNDIVQAFKTVTFIVSAEDAQRVENMLSFEEIRYRRIEQ